MLPSQRSSDDKYTMIPHFSGQDLLHDNHHEGQSPFPQIYDSAAVASTIRSFLEEEIAA